jgi:hypothetical protein
MTETFLTAAGVLGFGVEYRPYDGKNRQVAKIVTIR